MDYSSCILFSHIWPLNPKRLGIQSKRNIGGNVEKKLVTFWKFSNQLLSFFNSHHYLLFRTRPPFTNQSMLLHLSIQHCRFSLSNLETQWSNRFKSPTPKNPQPWINKAKSYLKLWDRQLKLQLHNFVKYVTLWIQNSYLLTWVKHQRCI